MTIAMQGLWSISIKSINAKWPQRFIIEGSENNKDGEYSQLEEPLIITGDQWGIRVEHDPEGRVSWRQSRHQLGNFHTKDGQFKFDIRTDDYGIGQGDGDFNDMILTCAMPLSSSEYVVYGRVKSYSGFCLFNPCFPFPFHVIDTPFQLKELLKYDPTRRIIKKLYPERLKAFERIEPIPQPDPPPFRPLMIPSGLGEVPELSGLKPKSMTYKMKPCGEMVLAEDAEPIDQTTHALSINRTATETLLDRDDFLLLGRLKDQLKFRPCVIKPVTQTLMRFTEYDRTMAEKLDGPYTGEGDRHMLGISATDDFGNYIFRFSQDLSDIAEEMGDVTGASTLEAGLRPDVMIELMESLPSGVLYETAPYYNIPNIRRINLCLPSKELDLPRTSCQGGRAIQSLGNLSIITGGTTLHPDGTISNTNTTGPIVDHAAWYHWVDLFACFLDTKPKVKFYTIEYRNQNGAGWNFVNQAYTHPKQQGDGTWQNEPIGPIPKQLHINGQTQPKVAVGAYLNIEDQILHSEWQNTKRDRKLQINTSAYQPAAGVVEFRMQGYDGSGVKVPGAQDTIRLYIDNTWSEGDIDFVKLGSIDPGECALIDLPTAGQSLKVRYRATGAEGFMASYALNVYRGSNTPVPTNNVMTGSSVSGAYESIPPHRYSGTLSETPDPTGYKEISLLPTSGEWLPGSTSFCAFSFELSARDRKTNGYGSPGNRIVWRELIGISFEP